MSGRAADVRHCRMSSSHPVKLTLSPQGSACAGIEPGTAGHAFFALTHSMNMHGRAAAMVTPIGDKKTLLPAESAVSSSGCAGRGRVKRGSSRKKKWKHEAAGSADDAKVCASASVAGGPECDFEWTSRVGTSAISGPLEMGRRPKHIYTLTSRTYPRGHLELSLGVL